MRYELINIWYLGITGGHASQEVCHLLMLVRYIGNCDIMGEDAFHSPQGSVGVNGVEVHVPYAVKGIQAGREKVGLMLMIHT